MRYNRRNRHPSRRAVLAESLGKLPPSLYGEAYRPPSNALERAVWQSLMDDGMIVLKRGWPDLALIDPESVRLAAVVEVKSESDSIRPAQHVILEALSRQGTPTYVYQEGQGFVPIGDSPEWRLLRGKAES